MTLRNGTIFWAVVLFIANGASALAADVPADAPVGTAASLAVATDAGSQGPGVLTQTKYTDAVAAVVNGEIITMAQLDKKRSRYLNDLMTTIEEKFPDTAEGNKAGWEEFVKDGDAISAEILHSMVDRILMVDYFHDKGFTFPQFYLDEQYDDTITNLFKGDHEAYLNYLSSQHMTETDYRKQLEDQDIVEAMTQQLHKSLTGISPDRIKAYYEQHKVYVKESVKVRQITLSLKPVADEAPDLIQQLAAKIVQEARQPGANFMDLAKRYSSDRGARDGDVPVNTYYRDDKNTLKPALQDVVFKLKPGEVSDPVVSDGYIFIFKCEDHTAEGYLPLDQMRDEIEKEIDADDLRQAEEKWLQKLRDKAFIQYNIYGPLPPDASADATAGTSTSTSTSTSTPAPAAN